MAYKIVEKRYIEKKPLGPDNKPIITAILDSQNDLAALGTDYSPGSVAMVADKGAPAFMLNASCVWKEI